MSLRRRLFLFVFIPVAVLYYGVSIFGVYQTRGRLIDDLDSDLSGSSASAASVLGQMTDEQLAQLMGQPDVGSSKFTALVNIATGDTLLSPSIQDGEALALPSKQDLEATELSRNLEIPFDLLSEDGSVGYRAVAFRLDGGRLLVTAEPLNRIDALTRRFLVGTLITGLLILSAMAAVVYIAIRSGLRPLRDFIDTTVRIAEGDLSERVDTEQDDSAFSKIALATNHMLDQVEVSYEKERIGRQRLNELVADAAHELRTPLTAIRGTIEMQSMGMIDTDDKLRMAFGGIDEHSERMVGIVEDLIVIARAENMRLDVESQAAPTVDLAVLAESQIALFIRKHPNRQVSLQASELDHLVAAEEALLRTAIDQLLDNTAVHTPDSTQVRVELSSDSDSIRLTVSDDGPGIPEDLSDRVFDRFVRCDPSRARTTGGAGLGLPMVQSIVESANGQVKLLANSDDGCTFELMLPRVPAESSRT